MKNIDEIFKFNLRRLVKSDGRDYEVLAEKCEMSVSMLNQLLSGKSGFSRNTIANLCKGLNCNPADLFVKEEDLVTTREQLILTIIGGLAALDYDELTTIRSVMSDLSASSPSRSKAAATE